MNKLLLSLATILVATTISSTVVEAAETQYEEKLPYRLKDPHWEKYNNEDKGKWPLPKVPTFSTGIYSMASIAGIDYKEDKNQFFDKTSKYKSSGDTEVYYKSNPSTPVTLALPVGSKYGKSVGGDTTIEYQFNDTVTSAYNGTTINDQLVMDNSQGQWLVTNGYYSRDNVLGGVKSVKSTISTGPLETSPWGLSSNFIKPEDFLMSLSKSVYGVSQSRPVYISTKPYRLSKKIVWYVTNPRTANGCGPITWKYLTGDWKNQDVSKINPSWSSTSPPSCGSSKTIDRGEYIVHPEGYLNNVWYRYTKDQNSFVSANVYELYFAKLLQKGILNTDEAFSNATATQSFSPNKEKSGAFTFKKSFADKYFKEYHDYGKSESGSKYKYPSWAPELGALYTNRDVKNIPLGSNLTDKNITVTKSGGKYLYSKALGSGYNITGNNVSGVTEIQPTSTENKIMNRNTIQVIEALKLIEKVMRVEDGDMTATEAEIVSKKYGAMYLDSIEKEDVQTVSYLLAKGILNFENYQEYSSLYSPLSETFSYKLIYRIANKEARLKFTEITLTDTSDLPVSFNEYKQEIIFPSLPKLSDAGSVNKNGTIINDYTGKQLTLLSDINFATTTRTITDSKNNKVGKRLVITADIDDPLKYLYRNMPLVSVDEKGQPYRVGNNYQVFSSPARKLYNTIDDKEKRYVGVKSIIYNENSERYDVTFYVYADSQDVAVDFIKANLKTRLSGVTVSKTDNSTTSIRTGAITPTRPNEINDSITKNGDLLINKDLGLTAYSNDNTSIVGNTLVKGAITSSVKNSKMTSIDAITKLTNNTAKESIGNKSIVTINSSQIQKKKVKVVDQTGKSVGTTTVMNTKVTSKPASKGKSDITKTLKMYNLSILSSADTLITQDQVFKFKRGKTTKSVKGTVVLSWELDLPTPLEQNKLIGRDIVPYVNDQAKASWIFTKPSNRDLLQVWNYNVGLNNALLKTLSKNNLNIPSGYFSPKLDILIDSVNSTELGEKKIKNKDISSSEIRQIRNNFLKKVSDNLSSSWVKTYIGSVELANYTVGKKPSKSIEKYIDKKKSNSKKTFIKTNGLLRGVLIPNNQTVWSYLVFDQSKSVEYTDGYFSRHTNSNDIGMYSIFSTKSGNNFYGYYSSAKGEGIIPYLNLPYAKDNFNNIYADTDRFLYQLKNGVLWEFNPEYEPSMVGRTVKFEKDVWKISGDNKSTYDLYSKKMIKAVYKKGKLYSAGDKSTTPILTAIHKQNLKTFGGQQEKGINANSYLKTRAFDFLPSQKDVGDTTFLYVKSGVLTPAKYVAVKNGKKIKYKLEKVSLKEGSVVYSPIFVTLSKTTWSARSKELTWSKSYIGAQYSAYTRGMIIQSLKEQILATSSKNIVLSQKVKTGTLTIGRLTGTINKNKVTFKVPFKDSMMSGSKVNKQEVINAFNENSDIVFVAGGVASASQYIKKKDIGSYDPKYKDYNNTLVNNNGKLQVATGTKIVNYSPGLVINTISLTGIVMDGVRFLNNGMSSNSDSYKLYLYQDVKPPAIVSPFAENNPPVLNNENAIVADVASTFEGLPTALDTFDSLQGYLDRIAANELWMMVLKSVLGFFLLISVLAPIAHILAYAPISNVFFTRMYDVTGIDFISIMSFMTVRITSPETNSWVRTTKVSAMCGILPLIAFGLMKIYDII